MHARVNTYTHICMHAYIHTCILIFIHSRTQAYKHARTKCARTESAVKVPAISCCFTSFIMNSGCTCACQKYEVCFVPLFIIFTFLFAKRFFQLWSELVGGERRICPSWCVTPESSRRISITLYRLLREAVWRIISSSYLPLIYDVSNQFCETIDRYCMIQSIDLDKIYMLC
jgi:hypothetical protein